MCIVCYESRLSVMGQKFYWLGEDWKHQEIKTFFKLCDEVVLKSQDVLMLGNENADRVAQNQSLKPKVSTKAFSFQELFLPLRGT